MDDYQISDIHEAPTLAELQDLAVQLELKKDEITRRLSKTYATIAKLKNQKSPIAFLPPETILAIFYLACSSSSGSATQFHIPLSQVCQSWREIAVQDPSLWDTVIVYPGYSAHTIESFLRRSRDRRLTIRLAYTGNRWPTHFLSIIEVLSVHYYRWQDLRIETEDQQLMYRIIKTMDHLYVPNLESVGLNMKDYHQWQDSMDNHLVFTGGAPKLSHISLVGVSPGCFSAPEENLRSFYLAGVLSKPLIQSDLEFSDFLQSLHHVSRLVLQGFLSQALTAPVTLPNLREFVLDGSYRVYSGYMWEIFSSIYAPNLESLILANGAVDDLELLFQMGVVTGMAFQRLKCLEIWDTQWMGVTVHDMLAIPHITHIKLIRCDAPAFLRRLRDARDPIPWPALTNVTIEIEPVDDVMSEDGDFAAHIDADHEFTKLICATVTTRKEIGAPLNTLALDSDLLAGIPGTRQVWLGEQGIQLIDNGFSIFNIKEAHEGPLLAA